MMDRSSKQNINKDIVALNKALDEMELTDIHRAFRPKEPNILFKCTWNTFKDRPHDRTQNKPQKIQENLNHIKYLLRPQGLEIRKQPQGKKVKNTQTCGY